MYKSENAIEFIHFCYRYTEYMYNSLDFHCVEYSLIENDNNNLANKSGGISRVNLLLNHRARPIRNGNAVKKSHNHALILDFFGTSFVFQLNY